MSGENDLLERATRALRATPPPSDDELLAAKQRLLAAQRAAAKSSRARTLRWVLPLAAMLAAGSAFAAVPGSFERVAEAVTAFLSPRPVADHKPKHKARPARVAPAEAPRPVPTPAPIPTPAVVHDAPSAESEQPVRPALATAAEDGESRRIGEERRRRRVEARASSAREQPPTRARGAGPVESPAVTRDEPQVVEPEVAPEPAHDRDLALYRHAHEKHFRARDFAAALRGWDLYLQAFPSGTFAVEARYNRAICLVRLAKKDEARRALLPFAKGEVARGYRQAEATKLLKALE